MEDRRIASNLAEIRSKVEKRCKASGFDPGKVAIVGVTKFVSVEAASQAVKAGLKDLGENRVQEAADKIKAVSPRPRWHLIGHLQKNKVKKAVEVFDVIESVDSVELAEMISKRASASGKKIETFLQVNSSGEATKHGFDPGEILGSADKINELSGLRLAGLMTLGPLTEDISLIRRSFGLTAEIFGELRRRLGDGISVLSMGMSSDFELALDYGANEIRIGTAIFGSRNAGGIKEEP